MAEPVNVARARLDKMKQQQADLMAKYADVEDAMMDATGVEKVKLQRQRDQLVTQIEKMQTDMDKFTDGMSETELAEVYSTMRPNVEGMEMTAEVADYVDRLATLSFQGDADALSPEEVEILVRAKFGPKAAEAASESMEAKMEAPPVARHMNSGYMGSGGKPGSDRLYSSAPRVDAGSLIPVRR